MITIKKIADLAGVSTTTVSNVLHGNTEKMSDATLTKVTKVLRDNNYVPNMGARLIACNSSKLIGVIINNPSSEDKNALQDPYIGELFGSMEREIRNSGYYMLSYVAEREKSLENRMDEVIQMALSWKIDGLIVSGTNVEECDYLIQTFPKPIVFIDTYSNHPNSINVGIDDENGGYEITKHLIAQGHQKICFLADKKRPIDVDGARLIGYKKALAEHNIPFKESNIISLSRDKEERKVCYEKLFQRISDFSALFFCSDYYASEGIRFLKEKNLQVPDDISVVGFDDNYFSQIVTPPITTVHQNVSEKGQTAVKQLITYLETGAVESKKIILPISLMIRQSVKLLN